MEELIEEIVDSLVHVVCDDFDKKELTRIVTRSVEECLEDQSIHFDRVVGWYRIDDSANLPLLSPAGLALFKESIIEKFRRNYEGGDPLGLIDALAIGDRNSPEWIVIALQEVAAQYLEAGGNKSFDELLGLSGRKGKGNKPIVKDLRSNFEREALHWIHWLVVRFGFSKELACLLVSETTIEVQTGEETVHQYEYRASTLKTLYTLRKDCSIASGFKDDWRPLSPLYLFDREFGAIWRNLLRKRDTLVENNYIDDMSEDFNEEDRLFIKRVGAGEKKLALFKAKAEVNKKNGDFNVD